MEYRCRVCDCHLDPGEGSLCSECEEEKERKIYYKENVSSSIGTEKSGQYKFKGELICEQ